MPEYGLRPVLVFDLDGTILRVNSFPRWMLFLMGGRIRGIDAGRRAWLAYRTASLLLARKLHLQDHDTLQRRLQDNWRTATGADPRTTAARDFQQRLLGHVRPNMQPLLSLVGEGHFDTVLATAASAEYATGLGHLLGFEYVLATLPPWESDGPPNRGPHKRDRVMGFLRDRGWTERPLILLTDHRDDLPLMRESSAVCWFGSKASMELARTDADHATLLYCRDLTGDGVLTTVSALYDTDVNRSVNAGSNA